MSSSARSRTASSRVRTRREYRSASRAPLQIARRSRGCATCSSPSRRAGRGIARTLVRDADRSSGARDRAAVDARDARRARGVPATRLRICRPEDLHGVPAGSRAVDYSRAMTTDKRAAFRALHETGCFVIPNPWDIGSGRLLQHMGFKALASTSAGSRGRSARPTTRSRRRRARAPDRAVRRGRSAGQRRLRVRLREEPDGVAENVRLAVATGVAGLSIEDARSMRRGLYDHALGGRADPRRESRDRRRRARTCCSSRAPRACCAIRPGRRRRRSTSSSRSPRPAPTCCSRPACATRPTSPTMVARSRRSR